MANHGQQQFHPSDRCGSWLLNRLVCLLRGHQELAWTGANGMVLPDGSIKRPYLCHACGCFVWVAEPSPRGPEDRTASPMAESGDFAEKSNENRLVVRIPRAIIQATG
jgi:hypothetical protein